MLKQVANQKNTEGHNTNLENIISKYLEIVLKSKDYTKNYRNIVDCLLEGKNLLIGIAKNLSRELPPSEIFSLDHIHTWQLDLYISMEQILESQYHKFKNKLNSDEQLRRKMELYLIHLDESGDLKALFSHTETFYSLVEGFLNELKNVYLTNVTQVDIKPSQLLKFGKRLKELNDELKSSCIAESTNSIESISEFSNALSLILVFNDIANIYKEIKEISDTIKKEFGAKHANLFTDINLMLKNILELLSALKDILLKDIVELVDKKDGLALCKYSLNMLYAHCIERSTKCLHLFCEILNPSEENAVEYTLKAGISKDLMIQHLLSLKKELLKQSCHGQLNNTDDHVTEIDNISVDTISTNSFIAP